MTAGKKAPETKGTDWERVQREVSENTDRASEPGKPNQKPCSLCCVQRVCVWS